MQEGGAAQRFSLGAAFAYLANMRIFWLMVMGLGACAPCMLCPSSGWVV
jgi:formate-dependent nitrite reductase membrane component NrfD